MVSMRDDVMRMTALMMKWPDMGLYPAPKKYMLLVLGGLYVREEKGQARPKDRPVDVDF